MNKSSIITLQFNGNSITYLTINNIETKVEHIDGKIYLPIPMIKEG